jgi:hypothetical protein
MKLTLEYKPSGIFFPTSHGKGASDGVGGTFKRSASRACLTSINKCLMKDAKEMYDWAINNMQTMTFSYVDDSEYAPRKELLKERYESAKTIPGTQSHHGYLGVDKCHVEMKVFSESSMTSVRKIVK